jgi:hypothetical protein
MTGEISFEPWRLAWDPIRFNFSLAQKLADFGLINTTSLFNLAADVAKAKSPGDFSDAWLDFSRRQLEAFSEQTEELSMLCKEPPSPAEAAAEIGLGD